jgi:hypothetical protein
MADAKRELGIDPLKAIKTVTMGFGKKGGGKDMSIILDTALNPESAPLKKPHVKKLAHKGQTYYDLGKGGAGIVVDGHTVIGSKARILKTIEQIGAKGALGKTLAAASKARETKAQLWVFGKPPMGKVGAKANEMKSVSGFVDLTAGVRAQVEVFGDPNWVKMLSGMLNMQKGMAGQNPMVSSMGLGGMLQKVAVKDQGNKLVVSVQLNEQDVQTLKTLIMMISASQAMKGKSKPTMPPGMGKMPGPGAAPPGMAPLPKLPPPPAGLPVQPAPAKAPTTTTPLSPPGK